MHMHIQINFSTLIPTVCKKQLYYTNVYSSVQYGIKVFG